MFHVELRRFPHVARAFNLGEDELRSRIAVPWVLGRAITLDERDFAPDKKTRLTIYEAAAIAPEDRGLGRGWSTVTRDGQKVTKRVLDEARRAVAPPVPMADFKSTLLAAAQAGPVSLAEAVSLAGPAGRVSERLAVTEQAVWELLHEHRLQLADAGGPVSAERWEPLLLASEAWTDPRSAVVLKAASRRVGDEGGAS